MAWPPPKFSDLFFFLSLVVFLAAFPPLPPSLSVLDLSYSNSPISLLTRRAAFQQKDYGDSIKLAKTPPPGAAPPFTTAFPPFPVVCWGPLWYSPPSRLLYYFLHPPFSVFSKPSLPSFSFSHAASGGPPRPPSCKVSNMKRLRIGFGTSSPPPPPPPPFFPLSCSSLSRLGTVLSLRSPPSDFYTQHYIVIKTRPGP